MSEFSDWGGMGLPGPDTDTAPAGAGGDPYGGGDYSGIGDIDVEALPTGALPGGADGQLTPFSPNGGWDFTDVLKGGVPSILAKGRPLVGPNGYFYDPGGGELPNLGTYPPVRSRSQAVGTLDASSSAGDIVRWVRQNTGLRVTARSIVGLIVRYGFKAAAALTQLDFGSLLKLFMRQKGVTHHRRGPGLYTVARKLRAADRLRATAARILGRGMHHARRQRRAPYHAFRRRSHRRRR